MERTGEGRAQVRWTAALLVLAAALTFWLSYQRAERRAVAELQPTERRDVYARELENLRALCPPLADGGLSELCRERAAFILEFPECDAACQGLARSHLEPRR